MAIHLADTFLSTYYVSSPGLALEDSKLSPSQSLLSESTVWLGSDHESD